MKEQFMKEAIRLSLEKMLEGHAGPFGAIVVKEDRIIGRGWNQVVTTGDPTAHAEMVAIREACRGLNHHQLTGCEIYASCEPCPMCLGAIYWARLDRVWYAATRQDAARAGFDDAFIYEELARPVDRRRVPTLQALRDEALTALDAWSNKADKTPY
jgi:guanine deaminase